MTGRSRAKEDICLISELSPRYTSIILKICIYLACTVSDYCAIVNFLLAARAQPHLTWRASLRFVSTAFVKIIVQTSPLEVWRFLICVLITTVTYVGGLRSKVGQLVWGSEAGLSLGFDTVTRSNLVVLWLIIHRLLSKADGHLCRHSSCNFNKD